MPVPSAEDSDKSPSDGNCPVCQGTGVMRWQQPHASADHTVVLREWTLPCVNGCGGTWRQPAAERDRVVDAPGIDPPGIDPPAAGTSPAARPNGAPVTRTPGWADEANTLGTDFIADFVRSRGFDWGSPSSR